MVPKLTCLNCFHTWGQSRALEEKFPAPQSAEVKEIVFIFSEPHGTGLGVLNEDRFITGVLEHKPLLEDILLMKNADVGRDNQTIKGVFEVDTQTGKPVDFKNA